MSRPHNVNADLDSFIAQLESQQSELSELNDFTNQQTSSNNVIQQQQQPQQNIQNVSSNQQFVQHFEIPYPQPSFSAPLPQQLLQSTLSTSSYLQENFEFPRNSTLDSFLDFELAINNINNNINPNISFNNNIIDNNNPTINSDIHIDPPTSTVVNTNPNLNYPTVSGTNNSELLNLDAFSLPVNDPLIPPPESLKSTALSTAANPLPKLFNNINITNYQYQNHDHLFKPSTSASINTKQHQSDKLFSKMTTSSSDSNLSTPIHYYTSNNAMNHAILNSNNSGPEIKIEDTDYQLLQSPLIKLDQSFETDSNLNAATTNSTSLFSSPSTAAPSPQILTVPRHDSATFNQMRIGRQRNRSSSRSSSRSNSHSRSNSNSSRISNSNSSRLSSSTSNYHSDTEYHDDQQSPIPTSINSDNNISDFDNDDEDFSDSNGEKRFVCEICSKEFSRPYNLKSHLRTHTNEKPYPCKLCGKKFARQHDRKRHEDLHSGEKRFQCKGRLQGGLNWGCLKKFARTDALRRHFWTESGKHCVHPLILELGLDELNIEDCVQSAMENANALSKLEHPNEKSTRCRSRKGKARK